MRRAKLYRHPDARKRQKILPRPAWLALRRRRQRHRHKNETPHGSSPRQSKSICPQPVNQVCKERDGAQRDASAWAEARCNAVSNAARGEKQQHQKEERKCRQRGREFAAAIAVPGGIKRSRKAQPGPEAEHRKHTELARRWQIVYLTFKKKEKIVAYRHRIPNRTQSHAEPYAFC